MRGLFHQNGHVTQRYSYGPFGEPQGASGSTGNPLRFAARELDATTGLYYVRARWYDPAQGRFISEDPIGLAGGINNYAYALNDPVNLSDPTGLCPPSICLPPVVVRARPRALNQMRSAFLIDRWSGIRNGDGVTSMSGVVFAASAGWQDEVGVKSLGPGPYPPVPVCPNTTPFERSLARLADRRSDKSGTEEGFFVSRGQGALRGNSWIDGPGVVKTPHSISGPIPFWAGTQIHNHPSTRGISEGDSVYAYRYGLRVVSGSAKSNVFGAINPGGARSTCVTPD